MPRAISENAIRVYTRGTSLYPSAVLAAIRDQLGVEVDRYKVHGTSYMDVPTDSAEDMKKLTNRSIQIEGEEYRLGPTFTPGGKGGYSHPHGNGQ